MVCLSISCFDTTINKKIINRFRQHYKYNVNIASIIVQKVQNWQRFRCWGGLSRSPPLSESLQYCDRKHVDRGAGPR